MRNFIVYAQDLILFMKRNKIIDNEQHLIDVETSRHSEQPDYFFHSNGCSRRIFFHHGYLLMKHIEERAESSQPLGPAEEEVKNFPQCRINDDCINKAQVILERLEKLQRDRDSDRISTSDIMNSCYQEYKAEIWENMLLVVAASFSMLLMILSLQFMLEELFSFQAQSKTKLYLLLTLTIFLNILMDFFDQNLFYESLNLFLKAKQPFILLFYVKTMGLTSYNIKNQNIERLINSISSDFNIIGQTLGYLMVAFRTPIKFIGITLFLIVKLKWAGAIAAFIMLMTVPVYYLVGKKTGKVMGEVNNLKDQRIKFYTQIIDGIKFIKIYGWEVAFTHIIQTLRNEQILGISAYFKYFFSSKLNWILLPITVILFLIIEILAVIFFTVLSTYDKVVNGENTFLEDINSFWLFLGLIQVVYCFLTPITFLLLNLVIFNSNSSIHEKMVKKLIRSQAFYFDVIPSNQLLSRFSNDLTVLDTMLSYSFKVMFEKSAAVLIALVTVTSLNFSFVIVLVLGGALCLYLVARYKNKIIYSRKVYLLAKDPIFKDFTEGVSGNLQLRLADQCKSRVSLFGEKLNREFETMFSGYLLSRTLGLWLCYTYLFFMYIGLIIGAYFLHEDQANLFGVQIILLMQINTSIQHILREAIDNQSYIISAERALQVTQFESEAALTNQYDEEHRIKINYDTEQEEQADATNPFDSLELWPQSPSVLVENLKLRYREKLPLVLKEVSFKIKEGQRVGIVGRTGAGKSSIFQALLRLTEPELTSTYRIGGYDALEMGLHSLRRNISVIPQNSFILHDSIRRNLDPLDRKSEKELWEVLERVSLKEKILQAKENLETKISDSSFFSMGEKQLFCLARVLLYPNKILILDEATSNVDLKTDSLIQSCIKEKFKYSSVLAIAHRLDTVADYDSILVMEKGKVVEVGSPWELVKRKGMFWEMIEHTGVNAASIYNKINQAHSKRSPLKDQL